MHPHAAGKPGVAITYSLKRNKIFKKVKKQDEGETREGGKGGKREGEGEGREIRFSTVEDTLNLDGINHSASI